MMPLTDSGYFIPSTFATWNPADKDADVTLTNGDLTLNFGTDTGNVRGTTTKTAGKFYHEVTCNHRGADSEYLGLCDTAYSLDTWIGQSTNSVGWNSDNRVQFNGGTTNLVTWTDADVLGFAFDMDNKKLWVRKNGGNWNNDVIGNQNPATNTGGVNLAAMTGTNWAPVARVELTTEQFTGNFGASAYNATPPAGFGNW